MKGEEDGVDQKNLEHHVDSEIEVEAARKAYVVDMKNGAALVVVIC